MVGSIGEARIATDSGIRQWLRSLGSRANGCAVHHPKQIAQSLNVNLTDLFEGIRRIEQGDKVAILPVFEDRDAPIGNALRDIISNLKSLIWPKNCEIELIVQDEIHPVTLDNVSIPHGVQSDDLMILKYAIAKTIAHLTKNDVSASINEIDQSCVQGLKKGAKIIFLGKWKPDRHFYAGVLKIT